MGWKKTLICFEIRGICHEACELMNVNVLTVLESSCVSRGNSVCSAFDVMNVKVGLWQRFNVYPMGGFIWLKGELLPIVHLCPL